MRNASALSEKKPPLAILVLNLVHSISGWLAFWKFSACHSATNGPQTGLNQFSKADNRL